VTFPDDPRSQLPGRCLPTFTSGDYETGFDAAQVVGHMDDFANCTWTNSLGGSGQAVTEKTACTQCGFDCSMDVPLMVGDNKITVITNANSQASVFVRRRAPIDVVASVLPADGGTNASTCVTVNLNTDLQIRSLWEVKGPTGPSLFGSHIQIGRQDIFCPDPGFIALTKYSVTYTGMTDSGVIVPKSWTFTMGP